MDTVGAGDADNLDNLALHDVAENGGGDDANGGSDEPGSGLVTQDIAEVFVYSIEVLLKETITPMSNAIEHEVAQLGYESNSVTQRAAEEKEELDKELNRLTNLVLAFQENISKVLLFAGLHHH